MTRIVKQPDIRKEELLDIGIRFYFELGEKGVSIQKIVHEANVATGLFYYYFKSKDEFLDEALNLYITKEIQRFEEILKDDNLKAIEKFDAVFDTYFKYIKEMLPYRLNKVFHTERHYSVTEKLIKKLTKEVCQVIQQGIVEKEFVVENIELTSSFLLGGLSSIFDSDLDIDEHSLHELKRFVNLLLKG